MNNKCIKFVENGYLILPVPSLLEYIASVQVNIQKAKF